MLTYLIAFLLASPYAFAQDSLTVQRVIDGATLELNDGRTVRLIGVDCPEFKDHERNRQNAERFGIDFEHYESYAQKANTFVWEVSGLTNLFKKGPYPGPYDTQLEFDEENEEIQHKDQYGRTLAYVFHYRLPYVEMEISEGWVVKDQQGEERNQQRIFLNASLVSSGQCPVYRRFDFPLQTQRAGKYEDEFLELEGEAREAKRGIWGEPVRETELPDSLSFLSDVEEFQEFRFGMSTSEIKEIVERHSLTLQGSPEEGFLITTKDGETVILSMRDGKCSGIQRGGRALVG